MNPEECWSAALTTSLANAYMAFVIPVASGPGDIVQFQSLNFDDDLSSHFRLLVETVRTELGNESEPKRILEFVHDYKPDPYDVEWVPADDELVKSVVADVPPLISVQRVASLEDALIGARFYAVVFELTGGERMMFVRRFEKNRVVNPSKNLLVRALGDRYSRLDEPVLQVDGRFDAIVFRGRLFVLNKQNFLYIFRYYEGLRRMAGEVVQSIVERIPFANEEVFRERCLRNIHAMTKLKNIAQKEYFQQINMVDLKRTIEANGLGIEVAMGVDGMERLVFNPSKQWEILNLLDDRYLQSGMTSRRYEANSKRELR